MEEMKIIEGSGGGGCFRAGTQIQQEGGKTVAIELLKEGDDILSFNERGEIQRARVVAVHRHASPEPIWKISFWRGSVHITPNHWVLNQYNSFVEMGSLTTHDALVDGMGHLRPIIGAEYVGDEEVWNLTVEPNHTFIADGIRVHNGGHRARYPEIEGSGGGGGKGGGGRAAKEDDDTLQSKASVSIVDLIAEGEIGGLVDGAKSIFLNDTPLMNQDGSYNFTDVSWDQRTGTQHQTAFTGDGYGSISTPTAVGVQLKKGVPHSVSVQNPSSNKCTVIVNVPQLMSQDMNTGDIHGSKVEYKIETSVNGGGFVEIGSYIIDGKTRSRYQKSVSFPIALGSNRVVRVTRITDDSTSSSLNNSLYFDTFVESVDTKLRYPNSALVALSVGASQFNTVPTRSYLVNGLYIKVPTNYDPVTRQYSGIWNGTFKVAISDNPAWILYDLLSNSRYGLGDYITEAQIDKATLYKIGRYCDELVSDGKGGTEPRFVCNVIINTLQDAYRLVMQLGSVFRGMGFWTGSIVGFMYDAPSDPVMIFNQANVINGEFSYVGSSRKNRHSVALITWNDPAEKYKQKIEYVEDTDLVARFGVRKTDMVAFGCTSRSQAHRLGRWILYTEARESQMISFKVGIDSAMLMPGEIVLIHDDHRAGKRMGGRAKASTTTSITLDAPITLTATSGVLLMIRMPDGTFAERAVLQGAGTHSTLTWTSALAETPVAGAIYIVSEPNLVPMIARVVGVAQGDDPGTFTISVLEHNPSKYAAIEGGYKIEDRPTKELPRKADAPTDIVVEDVRRAISEKTLITVMSVSWSGNSPTYEVSWRKVGEFSSNWQTYQTSYPSYDIENVMAGDYEIAISAINGFGVRSASVTINHTVNIADTVPNNVTGLALREAWESPTPTFVWDAVEYCPRYRVQIHSGATIRRDVYVNENTFEYTQDMARADGGLTRDITIKVKAVKPSGTESLLFASLSVSNPAPSLLSLQVTAAYLAINISYVRPNDPDFAGVQVWMSDTSGFTPGAGTLIYDGMNTQIIRQTDASGHALSAKPYYVRIRAYDTFDKSSGVISPEYAVTPLSASLGLAPGEIVGTHIAAGAVTAENLKVKRHMID